MKKTTTFDKILDAVMQLPRTPDDTGGNVGHATQNLIRVIAEQIDEAKIKSPNFGRPVIVKDQDRVTKEPRLRCGLFQFYGTRFNFKSKCQESVAIVELEDGQLTCRPPHMIQFTDN